MRSERRGVARGRIQFPRNALPEMTVMEKNERFISGGSGNAKWEEGRVRVGVGVGG